MWGLYSAPSLAKASPRQSRTERIRWSRTRMGSFGNGGPVGWGPSVCVWMVIAWFGNDPTVFPRHANSAPGPHGIRDGWTERKVGVGRIVGAMQP